MTPENDKGPFEHHTEGGVHGGNGISPAPENTLLPVMDQHFPAYSCEVTYRERIALPQGATLTATLENVTVQDAPAIVITQLVTPLSSVPHYVELSFGEPDENATYHFSARIEHEGKLLFITDSAHPVSYYENNTQLPVVVLKHVE